MRAAAVLALLGCTGAFIIPRAPRTAQAAPRLSMAVLEVGSTTQFDEAIKASGDALVVVDYSTTWCGPCKMIAPKFQELSEKYTNVVFLKVVGDKDADSSAIMKREGVRSVPSFHFWRSGGRLDMINGANLDALEQSIMDYAGATQ
eukprot:CAMPEP_0198427596 /NCGR_PEP_ID=MMETSP1452-20131203/6018_1 /TAXON_ID=1181717 /ORGANISM="Synchroma pusillum, Strain CCMP3072" /LENGTH=145 /DNA_ID=CAMNT_0044147973 /DNA_START=27 /DNA_END=464 /DNA_ORIENTATION=-